MQSDKSKPAAAGRRKGVIWSIAIAASLICLSIYALTVYWSIEPAEFDVIEAAREDANLTGSTRSLPPGAIYANTLAHIAETILNKRGGYISNDIFPGGVIDNMPAWEYGALVMLRDGASALRNHFARSKSQSKENFWLSKAEPQFYFNHTSFILPATEAEYQKGIENLRKYLNDLNNPDARNANFFARADNFTQYLEVMLKRLGDYGYRLSASSMQTPSYDLSSNRLITKTPWLEVDDVFWEARGATWALLHIFKAVQAEFGTIFKGKAAEATLRQIIQELEDSQAPVLSPVILNGDGFGLFANYSLTMANYITRANAATLDLRELMLRG